jgi:hypothetical protein
VKDADITIGNYDPRLEQRRGTEYPAFFCGCDPDLHTLSVAVLVARGGLPELDSVYIAKAKGSKGDAAVLDMISAMSGIIDFPSIAVVGRFVMAVESQDVSYTGRTNAARVSDLVNLAHIAGAVCQKFTVLAPRAMLLPRPQAWKGSVPKGIHQCRTLKRLGMLFEMAGGQEPYPGPRDMGRRVFGDKLNDGDWKDINDSIGLALYAWDWWRKGQP